MQYGLIGGRLGHSYSKPIHEQLAGYTYDLCPLPTEADADAFLRARDFKAINVTIPYKEFVMPYCDTIDDAARAIGSVNTIVNRNGRLEGHNTDFAGLQWLLNRNGVSLGGKTVMLLGTGGTKKTAYAVAQAAGAREIVVVSRHAGTGMISYEEAARRGDIEVLINTSPVGMYPDTGACLVDLAHYPKLEAVVDVIYNPFRTELLLRAEERGVKAVNGLGMLCAQAKYAAEYFTGTPLPEAAIARVARSLHAQCSSLVLIGMPASGKTSVGQLCAEMLGKRFVDADAEIEKRIGEPISSILSPGNEKPFRDLESAVLRDLGKMGGLVLATGGGAVLRQENVRALRQNGVLVWLKRPLEALDTGGARPLSQSREALEAMYRTRAPLYEAAADAAAENTALPADAARQAKEKFDEIFDTEWAEPQHAGHPGA